MATMPPLPTSWDTLEENHPTLLDQLPGSHPVSIWVYPAMFNVQPGEEMRTIQLDFVSPLQITPGMIKAAMDHVAPMFLEGGEELAFYFLWEKQEFDIRIPQQFCFFDHCWTPPWAGTTLLVVYRYRLWIVSRIPLVGSLAVRPELGLLAIVGIGIAVCLVLATFMGGVASIIAFFTGKVTVPQIQGAVKDIVTAPGENIKTALSPLTWAGLGVGVLLIGWGLALPYLSPRFTVTAPVGPARVTAGVTGAPAERRR